MIRAIFCVCSDEFRPQKKQWEVIIISVIKILLIYRLVFNDEKSDMNELIHLMSCLWVVRATQDETVYNLILNEFMLLLKKI